MKSKLSKKLLFVLSVFSLLALFVFAGSAASVKTVKQDGFVFELKDNKAVVASYSGKAKKVVVPSSVSSTPVVEIGDECFWQVRTMTSVSIPNSVTKIGYGAFNECTGLKSVVLPKKLSSLGDAAFWCCSNLEKIVFNSSIKTLGENVFRGCDKATVFVPSGSNTEKLVKAAGVTNLGYTLTTKITATKSMSLYIGASKAMSVKVSPSGKLLNGSLSFTAGNKKVATVSSKGVVKAVGCGKTVITVKAKDGSNKSAKCVVTVKPSAPSKPKQSKNTLSTVTIGWTKGTGATGYNIYRYNSAKKSWTLLSYVTKTSYTIKNLDAGEKLTVKAVSVFKNSKNSISGGSCKINVSTKAVSPVTNLKQSESTVSSATASWKAVSGAAKYSVQKYDASKKKWLTLGETKSTSYTVSGLSPAESVKLRVKAVFTEGKKSVSSKTVSVTLTAATPAAVSSLKKTASTFTSATVGWKAVKNALKYRVSKYDTAKKKWVVLGDSTKTSFEVSGLLPSDSVKLRVVGLFKSGSKTVLGNAAEITVSSSAVPQVESLELTSKSNNSLSFGWKACANVDGYNVYGYDAKTKKYTLKGTGKATDYSISSLKAKTEYCFAVKAFVIISGNKYESSDYSKLLSVNTPLSAVKDFSADKNKVTRTTVTLSWSACEDAEGYILETRKSKTEEWNKTEIAADKTSFVCPSLEPATEYQFRLSAFYKAGDTVVASDYTDILTVSTYARPETKKQAADSFAQALELTAAQTDYRLFRPVSSSARSYLPDEEKYLGILNLIDNAEKGDCLISGGKDSATGKDVLSLVPLFGKDILLSGEQAEKYVTSFGEDGSDGYNITLTLPAESELAASLLPDVKAVGKDNGLNVTDVTCQKLVIKAKVNNGRIDYIYLTVAFTAKGLENSTGNSFSFGETLERKYIFSWQ